MGVRREGFGWLRSSDQASLVARAGRVDLSLKGTTIESNVVGYNKVCELEDFSDETLVRYIREIYPHHVAASPSFPAGHEARKLWEVAQASRTLTELGALHDRAEILGVAAGLEATIFWTTNHARRVFATDLYAEPGGWEDFAPRSMLTNPGEHSPCPWRERRLVVQHMNALDLRYEDHSFDGVFCSSSIEHFGALPDVRRALAEMCRVLKPGGVATLSTEFRIAGPGPGLPGTLIFDGDELLNLIVKPFPWELVEPLDLRISQPTLATETRVSDFCAGDCRHPHIVLAENDVVFTSVHLALRKSLGEAD